MGCNRARLSSFSLQLVTGSVCTTNMQYLCQIPINQKEATHVHVPSKASELSTKAKEAGWKVPLPAERLAGDRLGSQDLVVGPF